MCEVSVMITAMKQHVGCMRLVHPLNSLVIIINMWLILISKT